MLTWRFAAQNVRDAVWAASPDYMWDASSWQGHMAFAYYRPSAIETWKDAADMSRMSIKEYSERWFPYPYPQISAVEGPISGMEYPMVAMENKSADKYDALQRRHARDRAHVVSDDRRLERADAHVAGRRLQHLHQLLLRGATLSRRRARTQSASRSDREQVEAVHAAQRRRAARDEAGPHRPAAARRERVREDRRRARAAARRDPRARGVRRRVPRVHAPLGVQASRRRRTSSGRWKT